MPRGGARPGGGRKPGTKNKSTIEREHRALESLAQQKSLAPIRALAKEQLAELVPVVKGIVARFQLAAINSGVPGDANYNAQFWRELRDWIKTYAAVADLAADFESPRYRAIAVIDGTGGVGTPFVIRAPNVMADSSVWQAAVGSAILDMEVVQASSAGPVALPHPASAQSQPREPESAPAAAPVVLTTDGKGSITVMPAGPRVVQPAGSEEWLAAVQAERRKVAG